MNKKVKIIIFCMIFVVGGVFGQKNNTTIQIVKPISLGIIVLNSKINRDTIVFRSCWSSQKFQKYYRKPKQVCDSLIKAPFSFLNTKPITVISSNFYTQNFGFFCKKELQLEKAIKLPLKFRLGSVEQCDWLEGK
jgi:hypothetical protein